MHKSIRLALLAGATLALGACFDDDKNNRVVEGGNPPAALNTPPTIAGSPSANALEGEPYEFIPTASDPDGDVLEFTIARKPAWATFDRATGRLSGTPDTTDVGNFTNVGISVSDGDHTATLVSFDITVNQIAFGSATISWIPPTENEDGSALTNLAGYRIYYGRSPSTLSQTIIVGNAGLTRYVVENLSPAQWHFAMTVVNTEGEESARSPTVSKTVT